MNPSATLGDLYDAIDAFAPFAAARPSDNCGIVAGSRSKPLHHVLLALDVTPDVVQEAVSVGADCIFSHHPPIYNPIRTLSDRDPVYQAIRHDIALIAAHTNLDVAPGGVNETYLTAIGLRKLELLPGADGCAALAECPAELSALPALAARVKACTGLPSVKMVDTGRRIKKAAVCCGGGASFFDCAVQSGADVYISGDFRHNHAVDALRAGISLIDAGHYETERLVLAPLAARLAECLPAVTFAVAASDRPIFQYL